MTNLSTLVLVNGRRLHTETLFPLTSLTSLTLRTVYDDLHHNVLDCLSHLTNLSTLKLHINTTEDDLGKIRLLKNLKKLVIGPNQTKLNSIPTTTNLEKLFISCTNAISNRELGQYTNLTNLRLGGGAILDGKALALLTNLTQLALNRTRVDDNYLKGLTSLTSLQLRSHSSVQSKTITSLPLLKYLHVEKCPTVTDYALLFSPNLREIVTDLVLTDGIKRLLFQRCIVLKKIS